MRHLTLVTTQPDGDPVQLGLALEGHPDADRSFWDLPVRERFDAVLDADPGSRERIARIGDYAGQLALLVEGLDPLERSRTALTAYRDADGVVRSRHPQLRGARCP